MATRSGSSPCARPSPPPTRLTRTRTLSRAAPSRSEVSRAPKTHDSAFCRHCGKSASPPRPSSAPVCVTDTTPTHMYLGENFSVQLHQVFKLHQLVSDVTESGLVHTAFDPFRRMRRMSLSAHARKLRDVPNAGGSSVVSEVLSYEVLRRCFNAKLLKTEMEVEYFPEGGSITDYVCEMFGVTLGVSVTRAMHYGEGHMTEEAAEKLLMKKLRGVLQSSQNTLTHWSKQVLHVWAQDKDTANVVTKVYHKLDSSVRANTVVIVTTAATCHEIFRNK